MKSFIGAALLALVIFQVPDGFTDLGLCFPGAQQRTALASMGRLRLSECSLGLGKWVEVRKTKDGQLVRMWFADQRAQAWVLNLKKERDGSM